MTLRRSLLSLGLLGLVASAAHSAVGAPLDVEAAGYGGSASGGWACGPNARVKYGGGGGEIRAHSTPTPESPEHGWTGTLGGAMEYRALSPAEAGGARVPSGGVVGAGAARVGYDWDWFGIRAGANAYEVWNDSSDRLPTLLVLPSLVLRGGPVTGLHFEGGLGSYDVPTITRPGLWLGGAWAFEPGWEVAIHGGVHQTFDGEGGLRTALSFRAPVTEGLQLGAGLALSEGLDRVEPEGQGTALVHFW